MPPRPTLPTDDLYARLGVPADASFEAIEVAWRGLLRRHHPDVAGEEGLEAAKRINVAHDWLSDPTLRARYDASREPGPGGSSWSRRAAQRRGPSAGDPEASWRPPAPAAPRRRRPATAAERVAALVERIGRLTRDDLDRLGRAEPAPIAFLATLRRFLPTELQQALDEAERAATTALPRAARETPGIRDAVVGRVVAVLLGDALDELLGDPGAGRVRERLSRGWDAAVGQPRYGPATTVVTELIERLAELTAAELRWLAGTEREMVALGPEPPWPPATSADEDEALRVSTELAAADAAAAVGRAGGSPEAARAGARVAHLLVLRHAFTAAAFDRSAAPWLGVLIAPSGPSGPRVRHRS